MRLFSNVISPIGFLLLALAVFWLVLPACAALPVVGKLFPSRCPEATVTEEQRALRAERERESALRARIGQLERELLALAQCPAPRAEDPSAIDPERWRARDLGLLDGCWELDSDYSVRDARTGVVTSVTEWEACFDQNGGGRQTIRLSNDATCRSSVSAEFLDTGQLLLKDGGDIPCSDGRRIFERHATCDLDDDNRAHCLSRQPDRRGGASQVRLRRR